MFVTKILETCYELDRETEDTCASAVSTNLSFVAQSHGIPAGITPVEAVGSIDVVICIVDYIAMSVTAKKAGQLVRVRLNKSLRSS